MVNDVYRILNGFLDVQRADIFVCDDAHGRLKVLCQFSSVFVAFDKQKRMRQNDANTCQTQRNHRIYEDKLSEKPATEDAGYH